MRNGFLKHFLVIGSGTFISMLIGLFTAPIITRIVPPDIYGQFSIFNMYVNIAVMILCLGLDQALVRYYHSSDQLGYKSALLFKCMLFPVILTTVVSTIFLICIKVGLISFEFSLDITILLCFHIIFQLIYRFSILVVRLNYSTKLFSMLNILSKSVYVVLALFLIIVSKINYLLCLVISIVIAGLVCLLLSIFMQKETWIFTNGKRFFGKIEFKQLILYGWPFIISMGITQLFQAIDKISLNHYCSYTEVGIYSSAMTLVNIFAIVQTTFNSLWAPMAIEHYEKNKNDRLFYQKGNQYITIVMFGLGLSLILFKDIFSYLLGPSYRAASYILPFLIFNPIMYTVSETTVQGIVFMKKTKMQIVIGAVACLTNFIGNTVLVPVLGPKGAAISTGISYIVFFAMRTIISNHYYYVDYKLKKYATITIITIFYASYNTFVRFNAFSIVYYILAISALVIIYYDEFKDGIKYICNIRPNGG